MYNDLIILLIISEKIERFVFSTKYKISRIFRYDFDWKSLELMISL